MTGSDFEKEFASSLAKETAKSAWEIFKATLLPPATELGKGLGDLIFAVMTPITFPVEYLRIITKAAHDKFRNGVQRKVSVVAQEKLCLPDPQIVFNTLQDARFCVYRDELREMFENLIASSTNTDYADYVHPAFSEIIRQLSPYDANILEQFSDYGTYRIFKYLRQTSDPTEFTFQYFWDPKQPREIQTKGINTLVFLGLVQIIGTSAFEIGVRESHASFSHYRVLGSGINERPYQSMTYGVEKDVLIDETLLISPTELGRDFIKVCIRK